MWFIYAITAAIFWGINYSLAEKIGERISLISLLAMEMALGTILVGIYAYFTTLKTDLTALWTDPALMKLTVIEITIVMLANVAIVLSIQSKNATTAGLIELSYPLFTMLFTWLLFHQHHLNLATIVGSVLIGLGVVCVSLAG
ncbi:MAG: DMT family transporter [Gammaproteobacteria bacterium]